MSEAEERPRFEREGERRVGGLRTPVVFTPPDYENDWVLRVTAVGVGENT